MDISLNSKDDRRARIAAFIFAIILLFLILYPFWSYTFPPPEKAGILVTFGEVEFAESDGAQQSQEDRIDDNNDLNNPSKTILPKTTTDSKVQPVKEVIHVETITEEKSDVVASKDNEEEKTSAEENRKQQEAAISSEDARMQQENRKAAEEVRKKAEYAKTKKQFGDLIGKGKGATSESGNAGDPKGDPSSEALKGLSKGNSRIQGGLADRGIISEPHIEDNSQKAGIVVVKVCVNSQGEIIESSYTQRGSTTTDTDLVNIAIQGAKQYRFSKSPIEKQCGTITIEFKLK